MKKLYNYNNFINEGIKDYLKPKSDIDIIKYIESNIDRLYKIFMDFCEMGYMEGVLYCLQNDSKNQIKQHIIDCGFQRAASNGHLDIVKYLVEEKGANINHTNDFAFRNAVSNGYIDVVEYLLTKNVNVHVNNDECFKLCSKETEQKYHKILNMLKQYVKSKENITESIKDYLKPKSEEDILSSLKDVSPNRKIILGCRKNLLWLIKKGLEEGADPSIDDNKLFIWACENRHVDMVKNLLKDKRINPGDRRNEPISTASKNGNIEIVKLLLNDHRVNPSDFDSFSLIWACENGHIEIVKLLLEDGRVDQYSLGYLSKKIAIRNGHRDIVKLLNEYEQKQYNEKILKK